MVGFATTWIDGVITGVSLPLAGQQDEIRWSKTRLDEILKRNFWIATDSNNLWRQTRNVAI